MWGVSSSSVDDRAAGRVEVCLEISNCGKLLSPLGPEGQKEELGCKSRDLQELQPRGNSPQGHRVGEEGLLVAAGTVMKTQNTRSKPKAERAELPGPPVSLVFPWSGLPRSQWAGGGTCSQQRRAPVIGSRVGRGQQWIRDLMSK